MAMSLPSSTSVKIASQALLLLLALIVGHGGGGGYQRQRHRVITINVSTTIVIGIGIGIAHHWNGYFVCCWGADIGHRRRREERGVYSSAAAVACDAPKPKGFRIFRSKKVFVSLGFSSKRFSYLWIQKGFRKYLLGSHPKGFRIFWLLAGGCTIKSNLP